MKSSVQGKNPGFFTIRLGMAEHQGGYPSHLWACETIPQPLKKNKKGLAIYRYFLYHPCRIA
ncbi:MAG TPA: hypothetical protein PLY57_00650 [Deltaproteobacteria bacterium]|nr:hypothetical protein [Deltaproteobacteria bacterium]